ncbi:guanylate kinase [Ischnura elegans]|uniref:guanylate kinase n=1 Tax=Ischnura elegans TaxID=197161 RepID=UPI001ED87007|nr:guanylate kinase [Ischnura elegans]XP_046397109.1 guanylate kinase [Ischnura elegans]
MTTIGDASETSQFDPGKGPRPLILCGPSGSGKSTLLKRLLAEFDSAFGFSVSHTTRKPREGEVDGRDYHFVSDPEDMKAAISRGEFLESAVFSGNMYGTSKSAVRAVCSKGKICVLDIDVQGVQQVRLQNLDPPPLLVFIKPPSMEILEERLRLRATESEESLSRRLETARSELAYGESPGNFDLVLVNDLIEKAYEELKLFILPEIRKLDQMSQSS